MAIALSFVLARASKVLVIPVLLLAGLGLGPDGLNLLRDVEFINGSNDIGLVLLLFYTSLFAHPKALRDGGRIALPLAAYDLLLNFACAYFIGELFDWDLGSRLVLGGVMATSSTGAILKILSDEGRLLRREGNVLVALLWIEDLAFIGYYLFLSGIFLPGAAARHFLTFETLVGLAGFACFLFLLSRIREQVWNVGHRETLIALVTGLGVLGTWLGSLGGLPHVGSAFTTGLVLSGSRGAHFIQNEAPWLREVASAIFFLSFGALLDAHLTWQLIPIAVAALGGILLTELLFLPTAGRLLGLTGLQAHVLGSSLLARGGKSAAFARLGDGSVGASTHIQSISGLLTIILTPLAPIVVRFVLWWRAIEERRPARHHAREVVSNVTRKVLAPGEYAQRNLVGWLDRFVVAQWFVLLAALALLACLTPTTLRYLPVVAGLSLCWPAYRQLKTYCGSVPGQPGTIYRLRRKPLPRLEDCLPGLLLAPAALALLLPLAAPQAAWTFPLLAGLLLTFFLLLPLLAQPSRVAKRVYATAPIKVLRTTP